jgi:hypothetical protein
MSRSWSFLSRWVKLDERSRLRFVFLYLLCADKDVPLFGDADKGYQWEIQIDEDWILY